MASTSYTGIFLLFLLSATSVLPSHADLLGGVGNGVGGVVGGVGNGAGGILGGALGGIVGKVLQGIQVGGLISCSATGNPVAGAVGLPGVNVTVTCIGQTTSVASGLTDANGNFNILVPIINENVIGTSPLPTCFTTVQLPVANCSLLPLNGVLLGPVNLNGNVLGLVADATIGLMTLVSI